MILINAGGSSNRRWVRLFEVLRYISRIQGALIMPLMVNLSLVRELTLKHHQNHALPMKTVDIQLIGL